MVVNTKDRVLHILGVQSSEDYVEVPSHPGRPGNYRYKIQDGTLLILDSPYDKWVPSVFTLERLRSIEEFENSLAYRVA